MTEFNGHLKTGDFLIKEGEKSTDLYWLQEGELQVLKQIEGKKHKILRTIKSGQLVGEIAFLDQKPRSASVRALTDCQVLRLHYDDFKEMLGSQPEWIKKIISTLCGRIRENSLVKKKDS